MTYPNFEKFDLNKPASESIASTNTTMTTTNTPPEAQVDSQFANREVKPSVDKTGEEVKGEASLRTRIADLEEMVRAQRIQLEYLNEKFGQTGTTNALLTRSNELVP
jgi:prophage antirepressor-like protein